MDSKMFQKTIGFGTLFIAIWESFWYPKNVQKLMKSSIHFGTGFGINFGFIFGAENSFISFLKMFGCILELFLAPILVQKSSPMGRARPRQRAPAKQIIMGHAK